MSDNTANLDELANDEVVEQDSLGSEAAPEELAPEFDAASPEDAKEPATDEPAEEQGGKPKKKRKPLPPKLQKIVDYLNAHENIRQPLVFFLLSIICGASQLITQFGLKYIIGAVNHDSFSWFIFDYSGVDNGLAEFVGFLAGAIIGQVMTFLLNRKTTFKSSNNIVISGVIYAFMAVAIIILQTYLGGVVSGACRNAAIANETEITGFIDFLITLTGLFVGGMTALVVSFLCNKLLAIKWPTKKKAAAEGAGDTSEVGADVEEADAAVENVEETTEDDSTSNSVEDANN